MTVVLPGFEWIENARNGGSAYADRSYYNYRSMLLLHMTVGMELSPGYVAGHSVPPHFWGNPYNKVRYETVTPDRAAYALYQPQFGYHWTNKHTYCLQTEIVGIPVVNEATYTEPQNKWIGEALLAPQAEWLKSIGEPVNLQQVAIVTDSSGSASEYWPGRWSEQEMADFNGVGQHIKAWGNDHWDCSVERLDRWAWYARQLLGEGPIIPKTKTYYARRPD